MTGSSWLHEDAVLFGELARACERLADAAPNECSHNTPFWQRRCTELQAKEQS